MVRLYLVKWPTPGSYVIPEINADGFDQETLFRSQGSEEVQQSVHAVMNRLSIPDALVNCSAGRAWDEQHCWFAGHLIKSRELALHYDYALPLGHTKY